MEHMDMGSPIERAAMRQALIEVASSIEEQSEMLASLRAGAAAEIIHEHLFFRAPNTHNVNPYRMGRNIFSTPIYAAMRARSIEEHGVEIRFGELLVEYVGDSRFDLMAATLRTIATQISC
jgi:hypothetical protein